LRKKGAAFVVAQAAIVAAVLALVTLPLEYPSTAPASGPTASSVSRMSTVAEPYQVVRDNVSVTGNIIQSIDCDIPPYVCAIYGPGPTLRGGQLINYQGSYYYLFSGLVVENTKTSFTVWFTNSTIYCVTPQGFVDTQEPVCPV